MTAADYWPLTDLRLRAGSIELRLPDADDLLALAALAFDGLGAQFAVSAASSATRPRSRCRASSATPRTGLTGT